MKGVIIVGEANDEDTNEVEKIQNITQEQYEQGEKMKMEDQENWGE